MADVSAWQQHLREQASPISPAPQAACYRGE